MTEENILDNNNFEPHNQLSRRRSLLPWWIKVFCWLFMPFGLLAIVCLFLGLLGLQPELSFYGFRTYEPLSFTGLLIIAVGVLKGITAFALWFEKDFAIKIGKADAIIGIVLSSLSMVVLPFLSAHANIQIRLELLVLIPYFIKLHKIEAAWNDLYE